MSLSAGRNFLGMSSGFLLCLTVFVTSPIEIVFWPRPSPSEEEKCFLNVFPCWPWPLLACEGNLSKCRNLAWPATSDLVVDADNDISSLKCLRKSFQFLHCTMPCHTCVLLAKFIPCSCIGRNSRERDGISSNLLNKISYNFVSFEKVRQPNWIWICVCCIYLLVKVGKSVHISVPHIEFRKADKRGLREIFTHGLGEDTKIETCFHSENIMEILGFLCEIFAQISLQ